MTEAVLPDPKTAFGRRVRRRLRDERVVWLTTVSADGTPQPNPVWFLWQAKSPDHVLVYSRADSRKLTHVRQRSRVSLNFDSDGDDGDIVVLTGDAHIAADMPPAPENPAYLRKYADDADEIKGDVSTGDAQSVALWIRITKVRGF
jgi:PPOX class probable F420-dependent enzyme